MTGSQNPAGATTAAEEGEPLAAAQGFPLLRPPGAEVGVLAAILPAQVVPDFPEPPQMPAPELLAPSLALTVLPDISRSIRSLSTLASSAWISARLFTFPSALSPPWPPR